MATYARLGSGSDISLLPPSKIANKYVSIVGYFGILYCCWVPQFLWGKKESLKKPIKVLQKRVRSGSEINSWMEIQNHVWNLIPFS
jgi:hypothetical protein